MWWVYYLGCKAHAFRVGNKAEAIQAQPGWVMGWVNINITKIKKGVDIFISTPLNIKSS